MQSTLTRSKAFNGQRLVSSNINNITNQDSIRSKLDKNTRKWSNRQHSYLSISINFHLKLSTKQPHVVLLPSVHIVYNPTVGAESGQFIGKLTDSDKIPHCSVTSKAFNGQRLVSSNIDHITIQDCIKSKLDKNTRKSSKRHYTYLSISISFHLKLSTEQRHVVSLPSVHIVYNPTVRAESG
jgi:hypothetical protein